MKRFPLIDPTIKYVPTHGYHPNQFEQPVIDPHKRKTEKEVPREPENTIHVEDMHEDDHKAHEQHYGTANHAHQVSIRKRNRMDKEEKERLTKKNQSIEHLEMDENPHKIAKQKETLGQDELHEMIISVFFRDKYRGDHDENDDMALQNWMSSNKFSVEAELSDHRINFQEINLPDDDHVQILCNDPEEREHIKHLLIRMQPVMCFMLEGKIIFGKFPSEFEKDTWTGERDYHRKKKKQEEFELKKKQAKIKQMIDRGEMWEQQEQGPEHTDL